MAVAVVVNCMTGRGDAPGQFRIALDPLAGEEKGGWRMMLGQRVEDFPGGQIRLARVERQQHLPAMRLPAADGRRLVRGREQRTAGGQPGGRRRQQRVKITILFHGGTR